MLNDDRVWKALGDATRREMLDLLAARAHTTGELCEHFDSLSRSMVMKHLEILVGAGLVTVRREGRFRWNAINPVPIQEICERWVNRHVAGLASSMLRLKARAEEPRQPERKRARTRTRSRSSKKPQKGTTR